MVSVDCCNKIMRFCIFLMNIDHQHDDLERNTTSLTVTLGHNFVWFVSIPFWLIVIMKLRIFGCVFVNTIVETDLTASGSEAYLANFKL